MAAEETLAPQRLLAELEQLVGERTRDLLERRRQSSVRRRGWLVRRMLLLADLLGLIVAFVAAHLILPTKAGTHIGPMLEFGLFVLALPVFVVVAKMQGLYDHDEERTDHTTVDDLVGVFYLVTVGAWLLFAGAYLFNIASPRVERLTIFWAVAILLITLARAGARAVCRRHISYCQNTVIVGAGDTGQLVARKLMKHPEYGVNLVGFVDADPRERRPDLADLPILGPPEALNLIVEVLDVERVIVAFSEEPDDRLIEVLRALSGFGVQIEIVPRFFDLLGARVGMHTVEGLSLLGLPPPRLSSSSRLLKTAMDVTGAIAGLILLAPLFGLIALLIKLDSRGPVFFRQVRMGAADETFEIVKFRTMVGDAEARKAELAEQNMHVRHGGDPRMFKVPGDPRVTRIGGFLRRWSLDELPQLINVLKGEMSLVGPRPLILTEDALVLDWARRRLDLKPGLTGLWQALGRSEIPFEEMVHLDYRYVTGWSLGTDIKLVLRTIPAVLRARQAY